MSESPEQPPQDDSIGDRVADGVEGAADLADSAIDAAASTCFVVDLFEEVLDACNVATAAHGDLDAPEVVLLRRYRDQRLRPTRAGRLFIRLYYRVGPLGAALINRFPRLRAPARRALGPAVWWARRSVDVYRPR